MILVVVCWSATYGDPDVISAATPNRVIQLAISARAVTLSGIASGHRVNRSTIVRRYVKPCEGGRGATRSTLICLNLRAGIENVFNCALICVCIFDAWHWIQARDHVLTCLSRSRHTNFYATSLRVVLAPGCESPGMTSKTLRRRVLGTTGRGLPVVILHGPDMKTLPPPWGFLKTVIFGHKVIWLFNICLFALKILGHKIKKYWVIKHMHPPEF